MRLKDAAMQPTSRTGVALALLCAMSLLLSFIEVAPFPQVPWLMYDPSGIVALVTALIYGSWPGCAIAVIGWIPRLLADPVGSAINVLAVLPTVVAMGHFYRRDPSLRGALIGALLGALGALVVVMLLNFFVLPLIYGMDIMDVYRMLLDVLLPFNVMKVLVNCAVALISYRRLERIIGPEALGAPGAGAPAAGSRQAAGAPRAKRDPDGEGAA